RRLDRFLQHGCELRRHEDRMRPVARDLRQAAEGLLGGALQEVGVAAGVAHDAACEALAVVPEGLAEVLGKKLLMAPGEGCLLRRLNGAARTLGEMTEVHEALR